MMTEVQLEQVRQIAGALHPLLLDEVARQAAGYLLEQTGWELGCTWERTYFGQPHSRELRVVLGRLLMGGQASRQGADWTITWDPPADARVLSLARTPVGAWPVAAAALWAYQHPPLVRIPGVPLDTEGHHMNEYQRRPLSWEELLGNSSPQPYVLRVSAWQLLNELQLLGD